MSDAKFSGRSRDAQTYSQKLRDPRWQKKRLLALERAGWRCEMCGDSESTLHVHHKQYFKGREPWEYADDQLAVLCELCHAEEHEAPDYLAEVISRIDLRQRNDIAWLISGFISKGWNPVTPRELALARLGERARATVTHIVNATSENDLAAFLARVGAKNSQEA